MQAITNFAEADAFFAQLYAPMPVKYSLDVMRSLMDALDNPQEKYPIIHVAGTSGKSSTAYYAAALLEQAGYKTGLTTSPHVDALNERVQVNQRPVPEAEFCTTLNEFAELLASSGIKPSWFEAVMAFAFWYFAKVGVDYAVIEVGLGGLLDATNVINRPDKVCVITDIGLDHTKILGNTLDKIAAQKAGIIQTGNTVFCYSQSPEVDTEFVKASEHKQAELHFITDVDTTGMHQGSFQGLPIFQQRNVYLASQAVNYVLTRDGKPVLNDEQLQAASKIYIPGRMEEIRLADGRIAILDGAHNQQKLEALQISLAARFPEQSIAALVAFKGGDDDRLEQALQTVCMITRDLIVTSFVTDKDYQFKSFDPTEIVAQCRELGADGAISVADNHQAVAALLSRPEPVLLVTGSFYLLNHIRPLLKKYMA